MFIENFLTFCSARLTRRYLTFEKYSQASPPKPDKDRSYLLYMHIPFCEQLCPYCSFVRVKFDESLACRYFDALKKEIEIYHELGYRFDSIYIGGGTPTIMPDRLAQIIEFVKSNWQIKQISIETNPNHLVPEILRILKDIGINRLSVGVQSFNNEILESIERLEKYGSGEEIKKKISSVIGMFDTVNVDMIFNFPNQTEQMLAADVRIIKELKADQVTYYPFIVSKFKKEGITERCGKIDYRQEKRLYQLLAGQLSDTYNQNSVWCFSNKKGLIDEYIIDHDDYVGLGPGSWGYINGTMYSNTFSVQDYISTLEQDRHPVTGYRSFSARERMHYYLLLKLLEGDLNLSPVRKEYGRRFWLYLWPELLFLLMSRAAIFRGNRITLTPSGRYYWVILMRTLFSLVGDHRTIHTSSDTAAVV
jgi:coproporphyrinogen III oxidase-like Fe-S oxidoreductase